MFFVANTSVVQLVMLEECIWCQYYLLQDEASASVVFGLHKLKGLAASNDYNVHGGALSRPQLSHAVDTPMEGQPATTGSHLSHV